jgi:hypothetical protein
LRRQCAQRRECCYNNAISYRVTLARHYQAFGAFFDLLRPPIGRVSGLAPQFCAFPPLL